jgi:hypothetical protein
MGIEQQLEMRKWADLYISFETYFGWLFPCYSGFLQVTGVCFRSTALVSSYETPMFPSSTLSREDKWEVTRGTM